MANGDTNTQFDPNSLAAILAGGSASQPLPPAPMIADTPPPAFTAQDAMQQALQTAGPQEPTSSPNTGQLEAPAQTPNPTISYKSDSKLPIAAELFKGLIKPPSGQFVSAANGLYRPANRMDVFEQFLGDFLQAFSTGMSQSGTGPAANARGFGGAVMAGPNIAMQRQQFASQQQAQQAQLQLEQARTQAQIQSVSAQPRFDPQTRSYLGTMTDAQYTQYLRGQGAAQVSAASKENVAKIGADNKLAIEQMKTQLLRGEVSKIIPTDTPNGKVMRAYNKFGQPIADLDGAILPSSYLPKESTTVEYRQLDDGSIVGLPKTTTTQPVVPGKGSGTAPAGNAPPKQAGRT